jgi:hypothetical protein
VVVHIEVDSGEDTRRMGWRFVSSLFEDALVGVGVGGGHVHQHLIGNHHHSFHDQRFPTFRFLHSRAKFSTYWVPRVLILVATRTVSSNLVDAAEWKMKSTSLARIDMNSGEIPRLASVTSPAMGLHFFMAKGSFFFNESNNCKHICVICWVAVAVMPTAHLVTRHSGRTNLSKKKNFYCSHTHHVVKDVADPLVRGLPLLAPEQQVDGFDPRTSPQQLLDEDLAQEPGAACDEDRLPPEHIADAIRQLLQVPRRHLDGHGINTKEELFSFVCLSDSYFFQRATVIWFSTYRARTKQVTTLTQGKQHTRCSRVADVTAPNMCVTLATYFYKLGGADQKLPT